MKNRKCEKPRIVNKEMKIDQVQRYSFEEGQSKLKCDLLLCCSQRKTEQRKRKYKIERKSDYIDRSCFSICLLSPISFIFGLLFFLILHTRSIGNWWSQKEKT